MISVQNSIGEVIHSGEYMNIDGSHTTQINLSTYAEGIYFIVFRYNDKMMTRKLILSK